MEPVSTKPYLLRAIYEWCADQGFTPYIAVTVDARTRVPMAYVKDGSIVLNIGPDASNQLHMGNDVVTFQARFNGQVQAISVPVDNVAAIYARENGQGMGFEVTAGAGRDAPLEPAPTAPDEPPPEPPRPKLTRVK